MSKLTHANCPVPISMQFNVCVFILYRKAHTMLFAGHHQEHQSPTWYFHLICFGSAWQDVQDCIYSKHPRKMSLSLSEANWQVDMTAGLGWNISVNILHVYKGQWWYVYFLCYWVQFVDSYPVSLFLVFLSSVFPFWSSPLVSVFSGCLPHPDWSHLCLSSALPCSYPPSPSSLPPRWT